MFGNILRQGVREHLCRGGGTFFAPPLGNIVTPLLKTPFLKKNDTFFNYVNYSIIYTLPYKC